MILKSSSLTSRLPALACVVSLLGGCPNTKTDVVGDTGTTSDDLVTRDDVHIDMGTFTAVGSDCAAVSAHQDLDQLDFSAYETYGFCEGSVCSTDPGSNLVQTLRTSGPCSPVDTNDRNSSPGNNTSTSWGEEWYAVGGEDDLLYCNVSCTNSDQTACNGVYKVIIKGASANCSQYDPVNIFLDTTASSLLARRRMDGDAECTAGSGRFKLVPVQMGDKDRDGSFHFAFLPFQQTGTGVMTRSAWITSIDQVSVPAGTTLRVVKSDQKFSFDNTDALKNADTVSSVVGASNTYSTGVIDGNAAFLTGELPFSNMDDFVLDMAWSCSSSFTESSSPQGYQFRLSDLGCTGYNQKMTLRVASSPNRVSLEQYGNSAASRTEPTQTTAEGKAFSFDRGGLSIDGVVLSNNAQQAQVKINYVRWKGLNICTAGTYTFAAE